MAARLFFKPGADGAVFSVCCVAIVSLRRRMNSVWLVWLDERMAKTIPRTMAVAPGKQFEQRNLTSLI